MPVPKQKKQPEKPQKTRKVKRQTAIKNSSTHRSTWKRAERMIAAFFGSKRTPLSGGNSGHTRSDTLHPKLFVEAKYRARFELYQLYLDTAEKALLENKIPIVAIKQKNTDGFLVLIDPKHMKDILKIQNE